MTTPNPYEDAQQGIGNFARITEEQSILIRKVTTFIIYLRAQNHDLTDMVVTLEDRVRQKDDELGRARDHAAALERASTIVQNSLKARDRELKEVTAHANELQEQLDQLIGSIIKVELPVTSLAMPPDIVLAMELSTQQRSLPSGGQRDGSQFTSEPLQAGGTDKVVE